MSEEVREMMIDKVALIVTKQGKILTTRSKGKQKFYIPGGKRERGENDIQVLCREIKEELSVDIINDSIRYFGTFTAQADGATKGVTVRMICYFADFTGRLEANSEIELFDWFTSKDLEKVSEVDKLIYSELKRLNMID